MARLRSQDLRGAVQLAQHATVQVSQVVEGVHQSVWSSMGVPGGARPGSSRGLTRLVYQSVRGVARLVGASADAVLRQLGPALAAAEDAQAESYTRAAVLAALNGVLGDHLVASGNPLATPMQLRWSQRLLTPQTMPLPGEVQGDLLLYIHGLCMNELSWQLPLPGLQATPLYLRYNSGLHISSNGAALAQQLEQLCAQWPVPVRSLRIVAHSMGGLVARSAWQQATMAKQHWPQLLRAMVFLGTPHHGAPLERAGNWIDVLLGASAYSRPFAALARLRSAGITDLRYGHVLPSDWQGPDRFQRQADARVPLPLPAGVACFSVAASLAEGRSPVAESLLGDGLVPLASALGQHPDPRRCLAFAQGHTHVFYAMQHMELLRSAAVAHQVQRWLVKTPSIPAKYPTNQQLVGN